MTWTITFAVFNGLVIFIADRSRAELNKVFKVSVVVKYLPYRSANLDIITTKAAEVFADNQVYFSQLSIGQQPLQRWPVEIRTTPAIINVGISEIPPCSLTYLVRISF